MFNIVVTSLHRRTVPLARRFARDRGEGLGSRKLGVGGKQVGYWGTTMLNILLNNIVCLEKVSLSELIEYQ